MSIEAEKKMDSKLEYRVGYWWSEKKSQKLNKAQLEKHLNDRGAELIPIDLELDLDEQGPFDAIIHKVSDLMCKVESDADAKAKVEKFEKFVLKNPQMIVIDTPANIRKVLDRSRQYKIIADSELADGDSVFTPSFVELTSTDMNENLEKLSSANVTFPLVCKPIVAHGTKAAHKMSLIFNQNGLKSITPPCVAQSFVNHNAKLFKLFIVKSEYFVIERPSLKNFRETDSFPEDVVHFDSHDISKPNSSNFLTELDEEDRQFEILQPQKKRLDQIVKVITKELGLFLLGIDVIIENGTGRYAIIDMNSFPGYDGVDNFLQLYTNIVIDEIDRLRATLSKSNAQTSPSPPPSSSSTPPQSNNHTNQNKDTIRQSEKNPNHKTSLNSTLSSPASISSSTANNATTSKSGLSSTSSSLSSSASSASSSSTITTTTKVPKLPCSNYSESGIDSGIDTSDSCDEKKQHSGNDVLAKFYRKQHSRSMNNTLNAQNNAQESLL